MVLPRGSPKVEITFPFDSLDSCKLFGGVKLRVLGMG